MSQWRSEQKGPGFYILDEEGRTVGTVCSCTSHDAKLMALAPELVDALLALTVWVRENASFADRPAGLLCEAHRVLNKSAGLS